MKARMTWLIVGLTAGLLMTPVAGLAAPSSSLPAELQADGVGKKPFIDKDGDGIRDGEEDRFRSRRRRRDDRDNKDTNQKQKRERNRNGPKR